MIIYNNFKHQLFNKNLNYLRSKLIKNNISNNNNKNIINFDEWLVGFTDGDGTFNIYISKKNNITFTYKLSQSINNKQILYKIKSKLKIGTINDSLGMSNYKVTKKEHLLNIIIPIFDKYTLLSSKQFNYLKFKKAINITLNKDISKDEKIKLIKELKEKEIPLNYKSPIWNNLNISDIKSISNINNIVSKSWLTGFIEAEGSFYLVKKDTNRIVHAFGITQNLDPIILYSIKYIFHISNKIQLIKLKNNKTYYYKLDTTNSRSIENIINYFIKNNHKILFLGVKNLEFSIWKRSYYKFKNKYNILLKIRNIIPPPLSEGRG